MTAARLQRLLFSLTLLGPIASSASAAPDAPRVQVVPVEAARFGDRISLSGTLAALRSAELSPRVDGLVAEVHVDAGDRVRAGDPLMQLDSTLAELALRRTRAELAAQRAALDEARRLYEEATSVAQQSFIPATVVASRGSELRRAEAGLAASEAVSAEQAELLARHALPAPFDGVIVRRHTESGEWVQRGTVVLSLVAIDPVYLDLQVPQERWDALGSEPEIRVHADALEGPGLPARIAARVPVGDPGARTFLLRLRVEAGDVQLLPGTSARADITLPAEGDSLAVPKDALLRQPDGGYSLFVVETNAQGALVARQRSVQVSRDRGTEVAVASGVERGERVVVRGNEALRDGQIVELIGSGQP